MNKKLIAILIFVAVAPACIHANPVAPCGSGVTLQSVILTTCTIGDKTFSFTGVSSPELSTAFMVFSTDTSHPNSPGFVLTPTAGSSFSATNGSFDIQLDYTVTITNPATGALITGQTSNFSGASITATSSTNFFQVWSINDVCQAFSLAAFEETNGVVQGNNTTNTQSCTATTSAGGDAALLITATNGTVSISSLGFYINETLPTPEPASLLLFSSGLCALASLRRKFRTGKK